MKDKINKIISENSEETHVFEYGYGIFITHDEVEIIIDELVKLNLPIVIGSAKEMERYLSDLRIKQLEGQVELLTFMVDNGLGVDDMMDDITYPRS